MRNLLNSFIRNITIITLLLVYNTVFGQYSYYTDNFGVQYFSVPTEFTDTSYYSATTNYNFENADPIIFNIYFYLLEPTDGSLVSPYSEEDILIHIARLNIAFNPYKIFFTQVSQV